MNGGHYFVLVVLIVSSLLNAAYLLPIVHRAFFREAQEPITHGEAPKPMVAAMMVTSGMCILLFFFAGDILAIAAESLSAWEPLHLP